MRSKFENRKIESVTISAAEYLSDVLFSDEIEINGKMFDIKDKKIAGDKIIVSGMYDEVEDELIATNNNLHEKKKSDNTPLNNITVKFSQFTLENFQRENSLKAYSSVIVPVFFSEYNEDLKSTFLSKTFPPPKQVC